MEPINVGVIVQADERIDFRLYPHASKRSNIDTGIFNQWKSFLKTEITGEAMPLFQPHRNSPAFLDYLARLCTGPILITRPLIYSVDATVDFPSVLDRLYQLLVIPPDRRGEQGIPDRPTGRFRVLAEDKDLLKRGLQKLVHVKLDDNRRWTAYRQAVNGEVVAVNKVEVDVRQEQTAWEIQAMMPVIDLLPDFLGRRGVDRPTRYYLLADSLNRPFSGQSEDEYSLMRDDLHRVIKGVRASGGFIVESPSEVDALVMKLDQMLPPIEPEAHLETRLNQ
jgi:hypothetical protein